MTDTKFFLIKETLVKANIEEFLSGEFEYVSIMSHAGFREYCEKLGFDIDIDLSVFSEEAQVFVTKAEVNYDSLTGTFTIPNRDDLYESDFRFKFVLDEKGIVFVDETGYVEKALVRISNSKKWRYPSLERFLFDFLEDITKGDLMLIEKLDSELDEIEDQVMEGDFDNEGIKRVTEIRRYVQELRIHYEQLHDFCQELIENENHFFLENDLRYFRNYLDRITRLEDIISSLRDHTMQIRDLYNYRQDEKQNKLMSVLTVVATIFMPLTLLTGWYGMNFEYMPELDEPAAYWIFIGISVSIVIFNIVFFRKKKWL